jgi:hypothetical protein
LIAECGAGDGGEDPDQVQKNSEIFYTLRESQVIIECWRREYNTFRPLLHRRCGELVAIVAAQIGRSSPFHKELCQTIQHLLRVILPGPAATSNESA